MRTGDTAANDRQKLIRRPPDLLITTPESLYLMLTSSARETLAGVETVIIDEIHAMATTKRGAHLMLTLERLEEVTDTPPQRIGLSATQRPLEEVAEFLGGWAEPGRKRPVQIVDAGIRKQLEIEVVIPIEDMSTLGQVKVELTPGPGDVGAHRAAHVDLAEHLPRDPEADPRQSHHDHLLQRPPGGRTPRGEAQRAGDRGRRARHRRSGDRRDPRRARARPPRLARPRAARRDRGPPQARRPAGDRGHVVAGVGHRHGRGRPRDPGRVAGRRQPRSAAHRSRRPPGG